VAGRKQDKSSRAASRKVKVAALSDLASFITGAEVPVDGGQTSHGCTKPIVDALAHVLKDLEDQRIAAVRNRWNVGPSRYDVRI
jgi:hypothetical protein